jgi:hypothetical protein
LNVSAKYPRASPMRRGVISFTSGIARETTSIAVSFARAIGGLRGAAEASSKDGVNE